MLLQSILEILDQRYTQPKSGTVEKNTAPPRKVEKEKAFSNEIEKVETPASAATSAAAEEATGMKKIKLEIAAAAGLLRPISLELPTLENQPDQDLEALLRTIEELKKPEELHSLDLFE